MKDNSPISLTIGQMQALVSIYPELFCSFIENIPPMTFYFEDK